VDTNITNIERLLSTNQYLDWRISDPTKIRARENQEWWESVYLRIWWSVTLKFSIAEEIWMAYIYVLMAASETQRETLRKQIVLRSETNSHLSDTKNNDMFFIICFSFEKYKGPKWIDPCKQSMLEMCT